MNVFNRFGVGALYFTVYWYRKHQRIFQEILMIELKLGYCLFAGDKKAPPVKQLVKPEEGRDMHADEIQKQDHNVFDFRMLTQHPGQVSQSSSHPSISMVPSTVSLATSQAAINSHNHMPNLNIPPPSLSSQSGPPSLHNPNSPQFSRHNSIDQVKQWFLEYQLSYLMTINWEYSDVWN